MGDLIILIDTNVLYHSDEYGIRIQDDGTHLFIIDTQDPDTIKKYELLTEWNINTLRPLPSQQVNMQVLTGETSIRGFAFKDDGTKLYVSGTDTRQMHVLELGFN